VLGLSNAKDVDHLHNLVLVAHRPPPGCILCSIDLQGTAGFLAVTHHHGGFWGFWTDAGHGEYHVAQYNIARYLVRLVLNLEVCKTYLHM
jgi:hypothetical protein